MATKRPTATDDAFWILDTLVEILNDVFADYARDKKAYLAKHYLFVAGLQADEIERTYRRAARNRPHLVSGMYWARLPEILELGRRLVAEHRASERQRQEGGAA